MFRGIVTASAFIIGLGMNLHTGHSNTPPSLMFSIGQNFGNGPAENADINAIQRMIDSIKSFRPNYSVFAILNVTQANKATLLITLNALRDNGVPFILDVYSSDVLTNSRAVDVYDVQHGIPLSLTDLQGLKNTYGTSFAGVRVFETFALNFTIFACHHANPEWCTNFVANLPSDNFFQAGLLEPFMQFAHNNGMFLLFEDPYWFFDHTDSNPLLNQVQNEQDLKTLLTTYPNTTIVMYANNEANSQSVNQLGLWQAAMAPFVTAGAIGMGLGDQAWICSAAIGFPNEANCPVDILITWAKNAFATGSKAVEVEPYWYWWDLPKGQIELPTGAVGASGVPLPTLVAFNTALQVADNSYTPGTKQELLNQFQTCNDQGLPDGCITPRNVRNVIGSVPALAEGVPNNAALKAFPTDSNRVFRAGFTAPGDGGAAVYNLSNSPCPLHGSEGDDGAQVKASNGNCWIADLSTSRNTIQVWGAVGNGIADDTAKVQAAIDALSVAGAPLYFDTTHKYLITSTLNVTAPLDIEGQFRYAGWGAQSPTATDPQACPWGLINNATAIDLLNVSAVTATVRGLCIQMSATAGTNPTSGIAMKFAPPTGKYQSGITAEYNTIIRPYDGIAVGGTFDSGCCGKGTTADGNVFSHNTILVPAHEAISNGKNTAGAASPGNSYIDNNIICHTITGSAPAGSIGFALYDGGIDYDGTENGPEGCGIGFKIMPGAVSGVGQFAGGTFRGVFGDQSGTHDLVIQPTSTLATVGDLQSTGSWAGATSSKTAILIDCSMGSCFNINFTNLTSHGGAGQALPVMKVISADPGSLFDFSVVGSQICGYAGAVPVSGAKAIEVNLSSTIGGRYVFSGNRFNTCPGTALPVGISLTLTGQNTHDINANISITNNDFSAIAQAGGTPIVYTPNNENVIITNNMGITEMTGSVADAATIALPTVSLPNFSITGSGTSVTSLSAGGKWNPNGEIKIITPSAITFGTGGNICNALTSAAGSFVIGRWNVASNCFNLK